MESLKPASIFEGIPFSHLEALILEFKSWPAPVEAHPGFETQADLRLERQSETALEMANEDLIYRITRAVYDRLGATTDEATVEQLVTDIYQEVLNTKALNGADASKRDSIPFGSTSQAHGEGSSDRMVISVFGLDHPGIVAGVSQILADAACSIVDINQTVVQAKFAMVIIADTSRARESAAELKERLRREGEKLGVRIYAQREDLFNAMHRI